MANREIPFINGMKVGLGYNKLDGSVMPSPAIKGTTITALQGAGGQMVTSDCVTITDVRSLRKALSVDVDAGGSYMGVSASAKVSYVNECDFSSYSTYVLVRVSVRNAFESVDSPVFTDDATALIQNNRPDRFRERFGDCFISGVQKGGEYFAIYQISGSDENERESLSLDVHAAYNGVIVSAELNVNIKNKTEASQSHLTVNLHVLRQGTISQTDLTLEDVMRTARDFPINVSGDKSYAYSVMLSDYGSLHNPRDDYNFYDTQHQQDVLLDLSKRRLEFFTLKNDISYILRNIEDFINDDETPPQRNALSQTLGEVVQALNSIDTGLSQCARDAGKCEFGSFEIGTYQLPKLRPGVKPPIRMPSYKGMTMAEIKSRAIPYGIWCSPDPEGGSDYLFHGGGEDPRGLTYGRNQSEAEAYPGHVHTDEQIIVVNQDPPADSSVPAVTVVQLAFGAAPGTP